MGAKASSRLYANISREKGERKHAIILFCVLETSASASDIKDEVLTYATARASPTQLQHRMSP
jgi:hypothetical protein